MSLRRVTLPRARPARTRVCYYNIQAQPRKRTSYDSGVTREYGREAVRSVHSARAPRGAVKASNGQPFMAGQHVTAEVEYARVLQQVTRRIRRVAAIVTSARELPQAVLYAQRIHENGRMMV